ncbi:hypothetical protein H5410_000976 [Solanum commersonii]|uniref:Uncharacterized protein n=1 Tax=Solanum commersonii TaxID=4109 RepID=A0A9J6AYF1_SOLCO|nr:hypothetical protein H5410_000976 [Solanum commersonii]
MVEIKGNGPLKLLEPKYIVQGPPCPSVHEGVEMIGTSPTNSEPHGKQRAYIPAAYYNFLLLLCIAPSMPLAPSSRCSRLFKSNNHLGKRQLKEFLEALKVVREVKLTGPSENGPVKLQ